MIVLLICWTSLSWMIQSYNEVRFRKRSNSIIVSLPESSYVHLKMQIFTLFIYVCYDYSKNRLISRNFFIINSFNSILYLIIIATNLPFQSFTFMEVVILVFSKMRKYLGNVVHTNSIKFLKIHFPTKNFCFPFQLWMDVQQEW